MLGLGPTRKIVSLDWDWRSLRLAQAHVSGSKAHVLSLVSRPLEAGLAYGDPQGLGKFIRRVLSEERISCKRAIVDIPRDQAVFNMLSLPAAKEEELAGLVRFQIVRSLSFPADEAVIDFAAEPPTQDNQQRILVATVRHDVLEFYRQVAMRAGLKLDRVGFRPYANLVALAYAEPGLAEGRTLFVDVGPTLTEIDIIVDGRLVFSRAASVNVIPKTQERSGAEDSDSRSGESPTDEPTAVDLKTDDKEIVKGLMLEVTLTLEAYRASDPEGRVDRAVVGGSCGIESELAEALHAHLEAPCRLYHPGEKMVPSLERDGDLTPFAATLGLVLSQTDRTKGRFDFLHPKEPEAVRHERAKRVPRIAATIALAFVAVGAFFWNTKVRPQRERLEVLTRQAAVLKPQSEKVAEFRKLVEEVGAWEDDEAVWLDELYRLASVLPENKETYLTSLSLKDPGKMMLKLAARNNQTANEIATKLLEMPGKNGKPCYTARTGSTRKVKDAKYPFSTEVTVEFYQEPASKKRGRRRR